MYAIVIKPMFKSNQTVYEEYSADSQSQTGFSPIGTRFLNSGVNFKIILYRTLSRIIVLNKVQ